LTYALPGGRTGRIARPTDAPKRLPISLPSRYNRGVQDHTNDRAGETDKADPADVAFSFVAPVYNEQEGLEHFYGRLKLAADELGEPYEIIFVNDGSTDDSASVIRQLAETDPRVKCVEFSRNFGHQVAVTAGYDYARGRAVISLDADCQHPPELIPQLVARWREGYEVVYTVRRDTAGISALRRQIGRLTYGVIRLATGADLTDQADFRLLDRKVVDVLCRHREHARFVRGLVHWVGFRQVALKYKAERRAAGRSSYSLRQLASMSAAGVFNFSLHPLRLAPAIGALLLAGSILYALVALVLWPFGAAPSGWTSVTVAIVALFGLQFVMLGVLGEYVGRTFEETRGRPLYIVRETVGFEAEPPPAAAEEEKATAEDDEAGRGFILYT
jgi:glycosyltransferase involved in cell wall biosynthesis